jgi:hypothetical protein
MQRLRFYLLLDANPQSCFLAEDPHSGPTGGGGACPPVPGGAGVRGAPPQPIGLIYTTNGISVV